MSFSDGSDTPVLVDINMSRLGPSHPFYKKPGFVFVEADIMDSAPMSCLTEHYAEPNDMMEAIQHAVKSRIVAKVMEE